MQVVTAAGKGLVRADGDLDVEVAAGTTTRADLALAGQLDPGARVDTGRDAELQRAAGADPSLAGALEAGVADHGAEALAGLARAARHHLAEEGPLDGLHLAPAPADGAGARAGARLGALAVAGAAGDGSVDGELLLGAEHRVTEVDVEPHESVLAALLA